MKRLFHLLLLCPLVAALALDAETEPVSGVKEHIPEFQAAAQLIVVLTDSWEAGPARLRRFERRDGEWAQVGEEMRASIGKKGMAWGIGLHGSNPSGVAVKKEGDGKSPAGVFELDELFGSQTAAAAGITRFAYRQVSESFAGVDDPASRHYNRIVDSAVVAKDWNSAENMVPTNGTYRLGCVVRHNWRPFPGYGSCIFIHIWKGESVATSGCTALAATDLEQLLRWLDQKKLPLLVQLPAAEYEQRKRAWQLP